MLTVAPRNQSHSKRGIRDKKYKTKQGRHQISEITLPCYWSIECYVSSSILVHPSFMVFPFCRPYSFYLVSLYSLPPTSIGILSVFLAYTISCGLHLGSGFTLTASNTAHLSTVHRDLTDDEPDLFHDFFSLPLKISVEVAISRNSSTPHAWKTSTWWIMSRSTKNSNSIYAPLDHICRRI